MSTQRITRELSICLLPSSEVTDDVLKLRDALPDSPYRDDIPHITLLRGVTAPETLEDNELLDAVASILDLSLKLPLIFKVKEVNNLSNQFYTSSGVLYFEVSQAVQVARQSVIEALTTQGYTIEQNELNTYAPHLTIRLGVPLRGNNLKKAETLFPKDLSILLNSWFIFRLIMDADKRVMRKLDPRLQLR